MGTGARGGQRFVLNIFLNHSSSYILKQSLFKNKLSDSASLTGQLAL